MASGGPRTGTPGRSYPNRRDMTRPQAPKAPKGQVYGQAQDQLRGQQSVPVAGAATTPGARPSAPASAGGSGPTPGIDPGSIPSLSDPTMFPEQAVTAGLPTGAGPGPDALSVMPQQPSEELAFLMRIYQRTGNEDLRKLIAFATKTHG